MALSSIAVASIDICFPVPHSHKTLTSSTLSRSARCSSARMCCRAWMNCSWHSTWQTGQFESHDSGAHAETSKMSRGNGAALLARRMSERRSNQVLTSPFSRYSAESGYWCLCSWVAKPPSPPILLATLRHWQGHSASAGAASCAGAAEDAEAGDANCGCSCWGSGTGRFCCSGCFGCGCRGQCRGC